MTYKEDYRDAWRYRWLRKHAAHIIVGLLTREGESLADLSPERVDVLVDREADSASAQHNETGD